MFLENDINLPLWLPYTSHLATLNEDQYIQLAFKPHGKSIDTVLKFM